MGIVKGTGALVNISRHLKHWFNGQLDADSPNSYPYFNKDEQTFFDSIPELRTFNYPVDGGSKGLWYFLAFAEKLFGKFSGNATIENNWRKVYSIISSRTWDQKVDYNKLYLKFNRYTKLPKIITGELQNILTIIFHFRYPHYQKQLGMQVRSL